MTQHASFGLKFGLKVNLTDPFMNWYRKCHIINNCTGLHTCWWHLEWQTFDSARVTPGLPTPLPQRFYGKLSTSSWVQSRKLYSGLVVCGHLPVFFVNSWPQSFMTWLKLVANLFLESAEEIWPWCVKKFKQVFMPLFIFVVKITLCENLLRKKFLCRGGAK